VLRRPVETTLGKRTSSGRYAFARDIVGDSHDGQNFFLVDSDHSSRVHTVKQSRAYGAFQLRLLV
jgi:hypothetical protein